MESKSDQRKFELGISNEKVRLIISQNILLPDRGQEFSYFEFLKGKVEYVHITHIVFFFGGGGGLGDGNACGFGQKNIFSVYIPKFAVFCLSDI